MSASFFLALALVGQCPQTPGKSLPVPLAPPVPSAQSVAILAVPVAYGACEVAPTVAMVKVKFRKARKIARPKFARRAYAVGTCS